MKMYTIFADDVRCLEGEGRRNQSRTNRGSRWTAVGINGESYGSKEWGAIVWGEG